MPLEFPSGRMRKIEICEWEIKRNLHADTEMCVPSIEGIFRIRAEYTERYIVTSYI
jgi:hypothetical protein